MEGTCAALDIDPRILSRLNCPLEEIERLCREFSVIELSVFGSVVRDDFKQDSSDLDFLVNFEPQSHPTFHEFFDLSEALMELTGKKVDLVAKNGLKETIKKDVLAESRVLYAQR